MASKAVSTKQMKLQRGDGAVSETFTTIGEVQTTKGPQESVKQIDVTSFDSVAMEYIAALPDGGTVDFDGNYVGTDSQQQALRTDMRAGTKRNFKLIANDQPLVGGTNPTTISFSAVITKLEFLPGGVNQPIKFAGSLKITGVAAFQYAS